MKLIRSGDIFADNPCNANAETREERTAAKQRGKRRRAISLKITFFDDGSHTLFYGLFWEKIDS